MELDRATELALGALETSTAIRFATDPIGVLREDLDLKVQPVDHLTQRRDDGGACDGVSYLQDGVILYAPTSSSKRENFTLAHELKHIIDNGAAHTTVYKQLTSSEIEAVCDHFATCLLMSHHAVYHLWGDGLRTPESLAMAFHISVNAMRRRMVALGLPTDLDEPSVLNYVDAFPDTPAPDTLPGHFLPEPPSPAFPGVAA